MKFALLTVTVFFGLVTPAKALDKMGYARDLIAMASFVKGNCVGLEPNYPMIRALIDREGIPMSILKTQAFIERSSLAARLMMVNTKANCVTIYRDFGPEGQVQPNLVIPYQEG